MSIDTSERERQRMLEVAREYRQQGYEVLIEPSVSQLPEFLAPFKVDMLARNDKEHVVIEIRSHLSITQNPQLDAIAKAIDEQPGWRFELVVTNPKETSSIAFQKASPLNTREIAYRLHEVRQLSEQEFGEAALLLAWSAAEALLRMRSDEEGVAIVPGASARLIKALYVAGSLDDMQYQTLQHALRVRNMVVHGYKPDLSIAGTLDQLLHVLDDLLPQQSIS